MGQFYLPIIVGSTRRDRQTPKVARFVQRRLGEREGVSTESLDLLEYDLPIMEERCAFGRTRRPGGRNSRDGSARRTR